MISNYKPFGKKVLIPVLIAFIALMVVASLSIDVEGNKIPLEFLVSVGVFNITSIFGTFFAAFGEFPTFVMFSFAFGVTFFAGFSSKGGKAVRIILKVVSAIFAIMFGVMSGIMAMNYFVEYANHLGNDKLDTILLVVGALIGLGVVIAGFFLLRRIPKDQYDKYRRVALTAIFVILADMIIVNLMKGAWGRLRYREVDPIGAIFAAGAAAQYGLDPEKAYFAGRVAAAKDYFTAWYLPQGSKYSEMVSLATGEVFADPKSFPSGHSADASAIFLITLLPYLFEKTKKWSWLLGTIAGVWTLLVMFSRIVMGAHYISDVTFGAAIGFFSFALITRLMLDRKPKAEKEVMQQ